MALETRIALAVFAAGLLLAVVALAACGGGDQSESDSEQTSEVTGSGQPPEPRACANGPVDAQPATLSRLNQRSGEIRVIYFDSGSRKPCSATVSIDGKTATVAVQSLNPRLQTFDFTPSCAIVHVGELPAGSKVELSDEIQNLEQIDSDDRRVRRFLFNGGIKCVPVPAELR